MDIGLGSTSWTDRRTFLAAGSATLFTSITQKNSPYPNVKTLASNLAGLNSNLLNFTKNVLSRTAALAAADIEATGDWLIASDVVSLFANHLELTGYSSALRSLIGTLALKAPREFDLSVDLETAIRSVRQFAETTPSSFFILNGNPLQLEMDKALWNLGKAGLANHLFRESEILKRKSKGQFRISLKTAPSKKESLLEKKDRLRQSIVAQLSISRWATTQIAHKLSGFTGYPNAYALISDGEYRDIPIIMTLAGLLAIKALA